MMQLTASPARAYAHQGHDAVRATLEQGFFAELLSGLLAEAPGGAMLDLGCGDGLAGRLAGPALDRYTGVDLRRSASAPPGRHVVQDLRDGLGPVGREPYDLYVATFGLASHLAPSQLRRLLGEVAAHARPGALVAIEGLGLSSLEWPQLWDTQPGPERLIPYRLGADVLVHPWAPEELGGLLEAAGMRVMRAHDRSVQAGPKVGEGRYWPGIPPLRRALNGLLDGARKPAAAVLATALPPLPAGRVAATHHALTARRRRLVAGFEGPPEQLARAVWSLEPRSGGGLGHGITVVARVT